MHSLGINGEGELRGQPGLPGKMAVKTECVYTALFVDIVAEPTILQQLDLPVLTICLT